MGLLRHAFVATDFIVVDVDPDAKRKQMVRVEVRYNDKNKSESFCANIFNITINA